MSNETRAVAGGQPEGRRERFQKWVLSTEHPVLGWLDGTWLKRGDNPEGYASEYVQGLWVAFKEFGAQPAGPVTTQEPIMLTAVAELIDDGDGGLEPSWLLEGGTAELFAGMTLLVAENAPDLCQEDGSAEVYTHADAGEVEQLAVLLRQTQIKHSVERDNLRAQLAERDEQKVKVGLVLMEQQERLAERDALLRRASDVLEALGKGDQIRKRIAALSASAEPSAPVERDPCPGCGVPGFTANCDKCIPY